MPLRFDTYFYIFLWSWFSNSQCQSPFEDSAYVSFPLAISVFSICLEYLPCALLVLYVCGVLWAVKFLGVLIPNIMSSL